MNLTLTANFTSLDEMKAFLGGSAAPASSAAPAPTTVAPSPAAPAAGDGPKPGKAKKPEAAAAPAADKEQAEIDGNTNAGCIIMIKRVAAMDGKNPDGTDKATGLAKATSIIQSHGGCKVSELPKDKWEAFIADCKKALVGEAAPKVVAELF